MNCEILNIDARHLDVWVPPKSVQTCVTSPPYYGLRDYGHDGQIGLEQTPEQYIAAMVGVFRCVRDVLADDGTLWVNIGDSYCSTAPGTKNAPQTKGSKTEAGQWANQRPPTPAGMKPKDLIGIPWMLAFALRADGAASPAHMRDIESMIAAVTDSYESRQQWPDRIAALVERLEREHIDANRGGWFLRQDIIWNKPNPMPESVRDRCTKAHEYMFLLSKSERYYFDAGAIREPCSEDMQRRAARGHTRRPGKIDTSRNDAATVRPTLITAESRNRRSVWTIATRPYKGAHFATFPPALIEPCIRASSRPGDTVLDPFGGSGTTAAVALALGRKAVLCELNPEYIPLVHKRLADAAK